MAEVNAAEKEAKAEAAFGVGFGDTPPAAIPAKVVEETKPDPVKADAVVVPVPVPEKPQYIRVTKQEWDNAKASLGKVSTLESRVAKFEGSMPKAEQLIQQVIDKVQAQTPAGVPLELTDEDFADFQETFPEVGQEMRKSLDKILKRMNTRGTAAPAALDESAVTKAVETILTTREKQALEKTHPTWKEIVGAVDMSKGEKAPEDNPFRQWLAAQPPEYQQEINNTKSPAVVQSAIDRFIAVPKAAPAAAKPDRAAARRAVIEDAVTPRADGNPPPLNPPQSVEDAFASGFKSGKPH